MTNGSGDAKGDGYGTRLRAALRALACLLSILEPDRYSGADACRLTELFAWGERLCATGKALAAKRVVDTGAWEASGARTAADWLARVSGQTAGQAAGAIDNAKRMRAQPDVEAAARAGRLSEQQSSAVSAAAAKAPDATKELLDKARGDDLAALRERSRQIKLAADGQDEKDRYRRLHASRHLRWWTDEEGAGRLSGRFTPDALAVIQSALSPFQEAVFAGARAAGVRERRDCHAADALVAMARAACGHSPGTAPDQPDPGGDPGGGPADSSIRPPAGRGQGPDAGGRDPGDRDGDQPAGRGSGAGPARPVAGEGRRPVPGEGRRPVPGEGRRPAMIIVRIDHAALVRGHRTADECCEIDGVGPVPVATVRAMMTDAFLAAVVTDGVDVRSVVHMGRAVTAAQRTALVARDRECVAPGCHVRHGLEIDHVAGWAATKVTTLDALARLCSHHHGLKTYEGWRLEGRPGRWRWLPPADARTDPPPARGQPPDGAPRDPAANPVTGRPERVPTRPPPRNGGGRSARRSTGKRPRAPIPGSLWDPGDDRASHDPTG